MGRKNRSHPPQPASFSWFDAALGVPACVLVFLVPFFPDEKLVRLKMQVLECGLLAMGASVGFRWILTARRPGLFGAASDGLRALSSPESRARQLAGAVGLWVVANLVLYRLSGDSAVAWLELRRVLLGAVAFALFALSDLTAFWRRAFYLSWTAAAGLLSLYGILQRTGGAGRLDVPQMDRVMATYGNPIFFGAFLVTSLFIASLAWRQTRSSLGRLLVLAAGLLEFAVLLFTETRAAWIAFFAAVCLAFAARLKSWRSRGAFALVALAIAGGAVVATRDVWQRDQGHLLIWRDTLRLWADRPVTGVGLGAFHTNFPAYAGEDLKAKWPKGQFIVNYAHNEYLQLLAEGGLISVVAFGAILLFGVALVRRLLRRDDTRMEASLLSLAIGASLIQNLFSVDMRFGISWAVMFALLGLLAGPIAGAGPATAVTTLPPAARAVGVAIWAVLLAAVWPVIRRPYLAQAEVSAQPDFFNERVLDPARTTEELEAVARRYPDEPAVLEKLAYVYAKEIKTPDGRIDTGKASQAISAYQRLLAVDPNRMSAHNNVANIYYTIGRTDEAIASWRRAAEIDPRFLDVRLNLGKVLYVRGDLKESAQHFQAALEIDPGNAEALVYLKRMVE